MKFLISFLMCFSVYAKVDLAVISHVFTIQDGFDDNDNVQVVVDGLLPNMCFELAQTRLKIDKEAKKVFIQQEMRKKEMVGCESGQALPLQLRWPITFTKTLSLGVLANGQYQVNFKTRSGQFKTTSFFNVKPSIAQTVDDDLYAPVSSIFIPEVIRETPNAEAVLTGTLGSSCVKLRSSNIKVDRQNNVIIIRPLLTMQDAVSCKPNLTPLRNIVSVGELTEGRYLIHVRSLTGEAINRVFTVVKNFNNNGLQFFRHPEFI